MGYAVAKGSDSEAVRAAFDWLRANHDQFIEALALRRERTANPNPSYRYAGKDKERYIAIMILAARKDVRARRWLCEAAAQCLADRVDLPEPLRLWLVERLRETARERDAGKGFGITARNMDKPGNVTDWKQAYMVALRVWADMADQGSTNEDALAKVAATISTKDGAAQAAQRCWYDFRKAFPEPKNERKKPTNIVR